MNRPWGDNINLKPNQNYLCVFSEDTDNLFLPFALLAANTCCPFLVAILFLNPCLFFLLLTEGWYVLFIAVHFNCE